MKLSRLLLLTAAFLLTAVHVRATNFVTIASQGAGASWTQAIWRTSIADPALVTPTAGNTYQAIANGVAFGNNTGNTRLRNPAFDGVQTFPGDSLTLDANTEIRFKRGTSTASPSPTISSFPGVGGNPGLILNGGVLNSGDDVSFTVTGRIHVASESFLSAGDNGGGVVKSDRAIHLAGTLTGPGAIRIIQSHPTNANNMTADARGFTGDWIVDAGFLRGVTSNSLGLGNIIIAPTNSSGAQASTNFSRLEVNYNIKSRGTLILDSGVSRAQMILHQDVQFARALINGVIISPGTHPYSELAFSFPGNFPSPGSGSITVTAPPSPTNLVAQPGFLSAALSWTGSDLAAGYIIKRALTPTGPFIPVLTNGPSAFAIVEHLANTLTFYFVISAFNDSGESADSAVVSVTPNFIPAAITTQPVGATNCPGVNVTFNAGVTGHYPVLVQWYFNRTNLVADATNTSLTINNAQSANSGAYTIVATNSAGASTSSVASLVINAPTTGTGPAPAVSCPGVPATFTVTAAGTGPFTYTWRFGTNIVQGPNSSNSLTVASPSATNSGTYTVEVAGTCGRVTNSATLAIATAPIISAQPANQTSPMGNSATFSATATAVGQITYQWQANGVNIPGATNISLTVSNLALGQSGTTYQVIITSCAGTVTSTAATLTVTPIAGISFDFDTPLQFTNAPYYLTYNDWISSSFNTPPTVFESTFGGVGAFPGNGSLDLIPNNGTVNSAILIPLSYDFSLPGKTLTASAMVKIKSPVNNNRNTQIGFVTSTNVDLDNTAGRVYVTAILQSTAQPAPTFELRSGSKANAANSFIEGNNAAAGTLTVSNWYRLKATFVNNSSNIPGTFRMTATLENLGLNGTAAPTNVATISNVTITNSEIVTAKNVYFVVRGIENTGVDFWDNFYANSSGGPVAFVQQPQNQSVSHGRRAVFRALVDGDGPYSYQWSKNGVAIPGARSWKYVTPPATINDIASQYTVAVTGPNNAVTSSPATLSVQGDLLRVTSVGSVDGTTVGVLFNQPVQQASAENPANYSINGVGAVQARLYRTSVGPQGSEGIYVILTPATVLSAPYTVAVQNVQDLSGNAIAIGNTATGRVENLTGFDVNPSLTGPSGENYSFGPGQFIITGGGADIFNPGDSFRYVYTTKTGDFDVIAKVPYLDIVRGPSKAGFSVRASLDPFSPEVTAAVNPMWPGRNFPEGVVRQTWNIATGSWGNNPTYNFAWYPDVWLRFRRVGNTFMRYSSTTGTNWIFDGQTSPTPAFPGTVLFGLAVCAVANNNAESAQIENYGSFAGYSGTIAITSQPTNFTVAAGSSFTDGAVAAASDTNIPPAGELAYLWQRTNSASGGWTNLLTAGAATNTVTIGPVFSSDNGAQFRVVVSAPGALSVTSAVFTATVTDTNAPTLVSANPLVLPAYPSSEVVLTFSELISAATATNVANYVVTNAAGVNLGVASAAFLSGDPRTVILTVSNVIGFGNAGVVINGLRDLNNNLIASNTVRSFRSFAPPTAPVVVEVYEDVGAAIPISSFITTNLVLNGTPTYITYSNLFGYAVAIASVAGAQDNYGVRAYTYFIPPTNGQYKFWIRGDDAMQLRMNTNGAGSSSTLATVIASSTNSPVAERAANVIDDNPNTKYLNFDTNFTGFVVTPAQGATIVRGLRFTSANDAPERDPFNFTLEGTTGSPTTGPWTSIASNLTGLATNRFATAPDVSFANPTAYTSYRLTFPTVRNPSAANSMQIAEVAFLDANGFDVTTPGGVVLLAELTANNPNYSLGTTPSSAVTNITLVAGQPYYMEFIGKEATGGDGFSVMWTDASVTTAPGATTFIPTSALAYPVGAAPPTPVIMELFTGYIASLFNNGNFPDLVSATNFPTSTYPENVVNYKYIAGLPDVIGYQKYFAVQPLLYNTRFDNYLGRIRSYFIPPTNGNYKFYMRCDDSALLFMNTNAVNSTDPAGKSVLGQLNAFTSAFTLVAQNVSLIGGQRYYIEGLWREGGSGDGISVAVRAQGDNSAPPIAPAPEFIPASMLEYPQAFSRAGAVNFDGIAPSNPTVADGQSLILSAANIVGAPPYGFIWLKNGVRVMENSFTNATPPLTTADNGSVYTLIVTNAFSRAERSATVTVLSDTTAPTILRTVGRRYNDGFSLLFSEPLDAASATYLGNYQISGGLKILKATLDPSRTMVSFDTGPQAPNTIYTVTVNRVRDASSAGNQIAANTTTSFSTWSVGGRGFLVEMFTNIPGTAIVDLTGTPKFAANLPDTTYYTNVFAIGRIFNADSDFENYGARITGYFVPTNTGYYRFYLRSDDASQLWMNINSTDSENPAGRTMLLHMPSAGISLADARAISQPVFLNQGQSYYIEGLLKEGGGGDYFMATYRSSDAAGNTVGLTPPADSNVELHTAIDGFGGAPGDSTANRLVINQAPPATVNAGDNEPVNLAVATTVTPPSMAIVTGYQWQKSSSGSAFTNIPGASGPSLSFNARLADNNRQYRVTVSIPGTNVTLVTTLRVTNDITGPVIVSAVSLDGLSIGIRYNEPVNSGTAEELLNYTINGGVGPQVTEAKAQSDGVSVRLKLDSSIAGTFTVAADQIANLAAVPRTGASTNTGRVLGYIVGDVGAPVAVGSSFSSKEGEVTVVAGGNDIWGTSDVGHLTLRPTTGDFDVRARVDSLTPVDPAQPSVSKAGIMVRATLDAASPVLYHSVNPPPSRGRDQGEVGQRPTAAAATAAFAASVAYQAVGIPNAWIRAQRRGNTLNFFRSSDGVNWFVAASGTMIFSNTVYLGLATCAHTATQDPNLATTAQYRDVYIPDPPTILVQPSPTNRSVAVRVTVSYSVVASNRPNSGPLVYQWFRGGFPVTGATNATFTLSNAAAADSGVYTVNVGNDGGALVSSPVTLTVTNQLPIAANDSLQATQNVTRTVSVATLLGNDSDPNGDTLTLLGVSGTYPATFFSSDFNSGLPPNTAVYGNALIDSTGGAGGTGVLKLTPALGSQLGSFIINDLAPGIAVSNFTARFKVLLTSGSGNPADGFSFSFANDLPNAAIGGGEEGGGSGLIIAFDNYDNGAGEAPAVDVKWNGATISSVKIAKIQSPNYLDVVINLDSDGTVDVSLAGNVIHSNLQTPFTPITGGRFGLSARTGGELETHWVDDLVITSFTPLTTRGGRVALTNNIVSYTPPATISGQDFFYYVVSDGQFGGTAVGQVTVNFAAPLASKSLFVGPTLDSRSASLRRGAFSAFFGSTRGTTYVIEYKNAITDETWTPLTRVVGTGDLKSFTDPGPLPPTRFYRVRVE